jgi:CheY-like chemotaxis protein
MLSILLIEDDEDVQLFIQKPLQHLGIHVDVTDNVCDALGLFKQRHYDLIITDIILADKSGVELIRNFKARNPDIKIIAISGGAPDLAQAFNLPTAAALNNLNSAKSAGADIALAKPFKTSELIEQVVSLIAA